MEFQSKQHRLGWLPQWQRDLIARYPDLYLDPSHSGEDHCRLRFGFECHQGWAGLIDELSATATSVVTALRAFGYQYDARITAFIFKQKLGELRWQGEDNLLQPFRKLWRSYTLHIKHRSTCVCELCGKSGELRDVGHGWLRTLCEEEFKKERRKKR